MKMNIDYIKTFHPCKSGLENLIKHYPEFNYSVKEFLELTHIPYQDKIRLVRRVINKDTLKQWVVCCAESVLYIYQDKYPNDTRVLDCIETTKKYLVGECTLEELRTARSAAAAAYAAADAANASAAYAANASAARDEQNNKNIKLLIALL